MSRNRKDLRTYISPQGWFSLAYPETWEFEVDEDCTTFYRTSTGEGALQISAYETDEPQSATANLEEYLQSEGIETRISSSVVNDGREIASCKYTARGLFTRVWVITCDNSLIFATYNSDAEASVAEQQEVDTIIESLCFDVKS